MNAPRQGLFASLLIISFAVHVTLMIHATNQQLSNMRAIQGELMTRQLADDSLAMLAPIDTVSLALMANRYSSRPDVSALKIMAADKRVLATSGSAPTRSGEIFNKKLMHFARNPSCFSRQNHELMRNKNTRNFFAVNTKSVVRNNATQIKFLHPFFYNFLFFQNGVNGFWTVFN